jgi:hypothetical protein
MRTASTIGAATFALCALSSAAPAAEAKPKAWHTSNFRFEMSGLPANKDRKGFKNTGKQKSNQIRPRRSGASGFAIGCDVGRRQK